MPKLKKHRIVKPAEFVQATYLESSADVDAFLGALRQTLEGAIASGERIEIR
jgi:hypothetical protein